jgi:hypothetical protein
MKKVNVRVDAKNRICLTKITKNLPISINAYMSDNKIILEPLTEVPEAEAWIFKPENKEILKAIKEGLDQKGTIKRGSFSKYLKK